MIAKHENDNINDKLNWISLDERNRIDSESITVRESIDTTLLASQRSVAMFVQRGFIAAEKQINLFDFISVEGLVRYRAVRDSVLTAANMHSIECPRLKSSEFTLLSLLLIDAIVTSQNLLIHSDMNNWNSGLVVSTGNILRVRAGRIVKKDNLRKLRDGDLELLRNFFPRKLL